MFTEQWLLGHETFSLYMYHFSFLAVLPLATYGSNYNALPEAIFETTVFTMTMYMYVAVRNSI